LTAAHAGPTLQTGIIIAILVLPAAAEELVETAADAQSMTTLAAAKPENEDEQSCGCRCRSCKE